MALELGEITEQIIGAAFEVYSILGYRFLERVYQRAMQVELRARGLKAEIEDKIKVWYKKVCLLKKSRSTPPGGMIADVSRSDSVFNPCFIRGQGCRMQRFLACATVPW